MFLDSIFRKAPAPASSGRTQASPSVKSLSEMDRGILKGAIGGYREDGTLCGALATMQTLVTALSGDQHKGTKASYSQLFEALKMLTRGYLPTEHDLAPYFQRYPNTAHIFKAGPAELAQRWQRLLDTRRSIIGEFAFLDKCDFSPALANKGDAEISKLIAEVSEALYSQDALDVINRAMAACKNQPPMAVCSPPLTPAHTTLVLRTRQRRSLHP